MKAVIGVRPFMAPPWCGRLDAEEALTMPGLGLRRFRESLKIMRSEVFCRSDRLVVSSGDVD